MNHVDHKLTHEKAIAAGLTVLRAPADGPAHYEIERLSAALYRATVMLRATPRYPDNDEVYEGRKAHFEECLADMREVINAA